MTIRGLNGSGQPFFEKQVQFFGGKQIVSLEELTGMRTGIYYLQLQINEQTKLVKLIRY